MLKNHRLYNDAKSKEQGFTLVELLVVILIIGILSAIAVPAFLNQRKQAVDAALKSDIHQMSIHIFTWKVKNPSKRVPNMALRDDAVGSDFGSHNAAGFDFKPSPGTFMKVFTAGNNTKESFCITAWNAGSSEYQTEAAGMTYYQASGSIGAGHCDYSTDVPTG